ncbi:hypothetical protein FACS189440_15510 [Bacteroidia bacterium]|nr:hypothetical protein FACS189440_15510 [Bacteroidia bacterium]
MKEFIERYASNITLPDGSKFDEPESQFIMDVPMAISGDGLVFAGWRGAVTMRKVWVVALPAPLDLVSRPQDLAVQVNPVTRNEVTLSWTEPTDKGSHLLDYYYIYRNGEKIESPFGLTFGQRFIDNTTKKEPCYTVKAYYTLGGFAEASEEGCMALSDDNTLASLTVSEGKLYPAFNPNVTEYAVEVFPPVETIVVTGAANDVAAAVEGNGTHSLVTGNNAIHIIVTAENGSTQTYTVNVERGDVGIDNVNTPAISIYPNPTTGRVYIRSSANKAPEIIVSNLLGEQLLRTTGNSVDLSGYAKCKWFSIPQCPRTKVLK